MANWDTPSDCVTDTLFRADEPTDGTSDFLAAARRALIRANHDFFNRHPWWFARAYPPGAFVTTAQVTSLTITVASTGTSVAGTLSATYTPTLLNRKMLPTGKKWFARITAPTAGTSA